MEPALPSKDIPDRFTRPGGHTWIVLSNRFVTTAPGCLQYVYDPTTGESTFLEVNARLGAKLRQRSRLGT